MLGDKYIYQIGNADETHYIFKDTVNYEITPTINKLLDASPAYNGGIRLRGFNADTKGDYNITINFDEEDEQRFKFDTFQTLIYSKPIIIFFYDKNSDDEVNNIYYSYAEFIEGIPLKHRRSEPDTYSYTIKMRMLQPYFYKCDSEIKYFDEKARGQNEIAWGQNQAYWGQPGIYWGMTKNLSFKKTQTLTNLTNELETIRNKPLYYEERFLLRENRNIYPQIDSTFTGGNTTNNDVSLMTSAECRSFILEFDPLNLNQTITIKNLYNGSDITITWIATASYFNRIQYNSYFGEFFDAVTGAQIPFYSIISDYTDDLLYLSPINTNQVYSPPLFQRLTITPQNTNLIKLEFLPTYH